MLFGSRPNLLYNVLGELFNVQISYFSNSKSEIAETINGMIFFVFLSNRPRIFHEYTNGGIYSSIRDLFVDGWSQPVRFCDFWGADLELPDPGLQYRQKTNMMLKNVFSFIRSMMTKSIDEILREAIERGEFQNLPGQGRKLDLDDYFNAPEDVRLGYGLLKSNNFVPEEVQMLKDIESLQEKLKQATSEEERKTLQREIETRRLKYNLLMDRFHRRR
jgi:hypothetical protein